MSESFAPRSIEPSVVGLDVVGLDVGGANLKFVELPSGHSTDVSFALWRYPDQLSHAIQNQLRTFGPVRTLAVTMTGELADCFETRRHGVMHIAEQVQHAAHDCGISDVQFYGTDGQFHLSESIGRNTDLLAASNWHALALAIGATIAQDGLLIDIGSTTTDVIAIASGKVVTTSRSDHERLIDRSLVYVGCRRTPVCALVDSVTLDGVEVPMMNEVFATIDDARLILCEQREDSNDNETSDGGPRTIVGAKKRLARMIGQDGDEMSDEQLRDFSKQIVSAAALKIDAAVVRWRRGREQAPLILSGHGQSLMTLPEGAKTIDLRERIGAANSRCAPSWAVASLCLHRRS